MDDNPKMEIVDMDLDYLEIIRKVDSSVL